MNTERIHNNEVYLDQNKGPNSTPIRHDDGAWSEDKNPLTTWTPSSSVATTVNDSVSGSRITPHRERRGEQALVAVLKQLLTLIDHRRRERRIRGATTANPGMGTSSRGGAADHTMSGLETDTVRFRRVAARSRALMDHRERRLEEAMSDPQRRTGLEAMFPGMKKGDYETLLAEVRGIEEDEFQALLAGSRKRRKEEKNKHDIGNGGDERKPSGGSGPSSLALHSLPTHSLFSTPHRGTNSNEWGLVTGGSERMEDHYPAPQHHPAYPNQLSYCENDRDVQGPQYTVVGGRGMNGRAIGQGKVEGGHSDEVRRGQAGMAKTKYGRGLPQMLSHQSYHQYYLSSSRPGQRDPGGTLASASPSAGSTGGIDKNDKIDRNGGRDPREPYYKHAYRRAHDDEKGGGNGREMPQSPLSPPSQATSEHRIPPPSFWKSSASAPCTGGAVDGLNNVIAHNQALLQRDDLYPSGAVRHCPAPNQDHDPLSRYAHQGASTNHSTRDTQDRIVHPRNPCEGWGSVSMVSGLQSQNMTAAGLGAPEIERHGYRNGRAKESRTPPPDPKRVYVRLCDLLERCGGNLDEVIVDPQTSAKLESILLGLKEKESRAKVGVCVERSQPPTSHTSEERDQYDVNHSYRRESESLNTERELPNHHRSGGKPENPHNPHTRQHLHSEKKYFHGESSDRQFLPVDRFYREPRGGRDTDGHQDGDGLSADFVLEKRKVSEDPLPTYSGMSRVPREPRVKMAKHGDGGYLMSSPRHLDWESGCSPEGRPFYPSPLPHSHSPLYRPSGHPRDHSATTSTDIPSPQPRMPIDPAASILLQQFTQSHGGQSQSQTPQCSGSKATSLPASKHCTLRTDSPETSDDNAGSMIDRYLPFTSASPEQSSTNMEPAVIDISEITQGEQHPYREVEADPLCMTRLNIPKNPPMLLLPTTLNKREKLDDIARRIPISVLRPYFNYRLRKAAEAMNISVTSLKRLCRQYGVKRWPYRQISGFNRAIVHLQFQLDHARRRNGTGQLITEVSEQVQELFRRRRAIIEHAFKSDDGENRSQRRISLDSDEEVMDEEAYMAGDMTKAQIVEDME